MKKFTGLLLVAGTTMSLSACSMSLPTCYDELNECGRDTAYTEERTVKANRKAVEPTPVVVIEEKIIVQPEPEPAPVIIDDTPIMTTAEPQFKQISK